MKEKLHPGMERYLKTTYGSEKFPPHLLGPYAIRYHNLLWQHNWRNCRQSQRRRLRSWDRRSLCG